MHLHIYVFDCVCLAWREVNGQKLETITSFKYLGSVITDEGSKPKILSRIAKATAELTL